MSSRDAFIAQLIAALQENEALAADGSSIHQQSHSGSSPTEDAQTEQLFSFAASRIPSTSAMARRAYDALQFDYPLVDDDALRALADVYRSITEQLPTRQMALELAQEFPVTTAMVDAIEFLNDSMNKRRGTEASGLLAAALLVLVPRFCVAHPLDPVAAALLQELRVKISPVLATITPAATETKTLLDQFKHTDDESEQAELQFSGGFVEIYAAEEDPDDLSLVYEGSMPTAAQQPWLTVAPPPPPPPPAASSVPHTAQLHLLASKTYSTCFSLVSSTLWEDWKLHDALHELIQELLFHPPESSDQEQEQEHTASLYGEHGEWLRYLFVVRDQLLRFADHSDACTSGLRTLKSLIEKSSSSKTTQVASSRSSDPFFSSSSSFTTKSTTTATTPQTSAEEQLRRMALRVLAELAVSKEFNAAQSRRSQHVLALTIQQLFPVILRELTRLAPLVTGSSSSSSSSADEDVVLVLLQLLHFVVVAADSTATSQQLAIDKLQDSGLLRAWLAFLPPPSSPPPPSADGNTTATTPAREWPWLAPLLRLFGESALWNHEFASYVYRVPKLKTLLTQTQSQNQELSSESLLLEIAFAQHDLLLGKSHWTERLASEEIFPSACGSYIESMHKMGDAVFLLDVLAKAVSSLQPSVAEQLRRSLQSIYSTRFSTAFQYPTFAVPEDEVAESLLKEEPEPPPQDSESKAEETENRGRAEALQFVALRNRLRQCAKSILLSQFTGSGVSSFATSSSKLD